MKLDGLTRLLLETFGQTKLKDTPLGEWTVDSLAELIGVCREAGLPEKAPRRANSGPEKAKTRKVAPPAEPRKDAGKRPVVPEEMARRSSSRQLSGKYMGLIRGIEGVRARDKIKRIAKVDGLGAAIAFMEQMKSRRA